MAKGGGSTRTVSTNNASASRTTSTRNHRAGPGFTEPIKGPKEPSSSQTEIQYVYVDKLTGNQSDGYKNLDAVKTAIKRVEKEDKRAGTYEKDSYYIERVENIKGRGRSEYWHFGK